MNKAIKIIGIIAGVNLVAANLIGPYTAPILGEVTPVYMEVDCILTGKQQTMMTQNKAASLVKQISTMGIGFNIDVCNPFN